MLFLALLAISFHSDFEGGSLGKTERVSDSHFRCPVEGEADQDGRNRQASWYYFRIDGAPAGKPLTIELTGLVGEYNYRKGSHAVEKGTKPVYSYDNSHWKHFSAEEVEWDEKQVRLFVKFTPAAARLWIAHVAPYTTEHLSRLASEFRASPYLKRTSVGKTVEGREMPLWTITNGARPDAPKKVIWLMARQHSWETGTSWVAEGAVRFLLSEQADARRIRDEVVFQIFPMADPDGCARGGVRFNKNGYDLNRNWDTVDPVKMPEITAQRKALFDWLDSSRRIDVFLSLHNTETVDYLTGGFEAGGPAFRALAERLHKLLVETTTYNPARLPLEAGSSTTPGKPGRMAVYQGLMHDRKIPALLMEQMVNFNSKLNRHPTVEDRLAFGAGLARALWQAVQ